MSPENIRVRFAPSPTGFLHIGGVRTALFNWLFARKNGGKFLIRIEDTDQTRHTEEAIDVIYEGLKWLGLEWDEEPVRQTARRDRYPVYTQKMLDLDKAYRCYCTPEEIEQMRQEQTERGEAPRYDGRCRNRADQPEDKPYALRFKVPEEGYVQYNDLVYGPIRVDFKEMEDFVILKKDGLPTYNFANMVDDYEQEISHVIRGDDHINNTPRQVALYQALGLEPPEYAHLPVIVDENRKKLSKRHAAANILKYKEDGVLPEALLNYIAKLGWGFGDQEFFTLEELIDKFSLDRVGKAACAIDEDKFQWLCGKHMEAADTAKLAPEWLEHLQRKGIIDAEKAAGLSSEWVAAAVESLKPRAKTLSEMAEKGRFYFEAPAEYDPKGVKKFLKAGVRPAIEDLVAGIEKLSEPMQEKELEDLFRDILEKHETKMLKVAQPVRIFLTGGTASPGIFEILTLIGKEESLARLKKGLEFWDAIS
jgi:glutamyl-tRNA synthetase